MRCKANNPLKTQPRSAETAVRDNGVPGCWLGAMARTRREYRTGNSTPPLPQSTACMPDARCSQACRAATRQPAVVVFTLHNRTATWHMAGNMSCREC